MTTILDTALVTANEFLHWDDGGIPSELVRGKVVEMNRPFTSHGYFLARIAFLFHQYLQDHDIGRVVAGDAGVVTEHNPDTVRGPDVAFYSFARIPRGPLPEGYWSRTPELVVEIRSGDDRWKDIYRKAAEYLSADVLTVAVADPTTQRIHLFTADQEATVFNVDDNLEFPDILPGFSVPVKKIFE